MRIQRGIFLSILLFVLLIPTLAIARSWQVRSTMTRLEIQSIIDKAGDGDVIKFNRGIYDFSQEPRLGLYPNDGLFVIKDKSLTIRGHNQAQIFGPDSINPNSSNTLGLYAFYVQNLACDKDVVFKGLYICNFLRGIASMYLIEFDPQSALPNTRHIRIENCIFRNIHREAVSLQAVQGSISILNNDINAYRAIDIGWSQSSWQPPVSSTTIMDNHMQVQRVGIMLFSVNTANIHNNEIHGGILGMCFYGARAVPGTSIEGNTLQDQELWGIEMDGFIRDGNILETTGLTVQYNNILNTGGWGIFMRGPVTTENIIKNNFIHVEPDDITIEYATGIYSDGHHNAFINNTITGSGQYAIHLGFWYAHGNNEYIFENFVGGFTAQRAHYFLSPYTYANRLVGTWEENVVYEDLGSGNLIEKIFQK